MKGGVALALGVMRELAERPELYAEAAVLLVNDEEWRTVPSPTRSASRTGTPVCASRPASSTRDGNDAVIVKRKAAGTLEVQATGTPAHSGSAPEKGRSALLALAAVAQRVAASADPAGPARLTAVPTILQLRRGVQRGPAARSPDLRPARGLAGGVRAGAGGRAGGARRGRHRLHAGAGVAGHGHACRHRVPARPRGERAWAARWWPPSAAAPATRATSRRRSSSPSTASARAAAGAHAPHEWVGVESLRTRAEVALALAAAILEGVTGSLSGAFGSARRHPAPHAPVRPPRERRREARSVRRLGDAGAVRGHPRRARGRAHRRGHVRRLAHGRDRDQRARRRALPAAAALQRRHQARRAAAPSTRCSAARTAACSTTCSPTGSAGGRFLTVTNAANHEKDLRLVSRARRAASTSRSRDAAADWAMLAVQGPRGARGARARSPTASCPRACARPSSSWRASTASSAAPATPARTACELLLPPDGAAAVWDALLERGVTPVGPGRARHAAPRGLLPPLRQRPVRGPQPDRGGPGLVLQARHGLHRRRGAARRRAGPDARAVRLHRPGHPAPGQPGRRRRTARAW